MLQQPGASRAAATQQMKPAAQSRLLASSCRGSRVFVPFGTQGPAWQHRSSLQQAVCTPRQLQGQRPARCRVASAAAAPAAAAPASLAAKRSTARPLTRDEVILPSDPVNNVSDYIFAKIGSNLHMRADHPICLIKTAIYEYFQKRDPGVFTTFDDLYPIVTTRQNFDEMLVPEDHVSRSPNDTYYVNADTVLRCHTSAHQAEVLRAGHPAFLVTGDVYRRDSIDATHYPVFHQMEAVRVYKESDWQAAGLDATEFAVRELKSSLEGMARHLFGDVECRWIDAYFPFTEPSFELEIFFKGKWLEVLGCGVMQQKILDANYQASGAAAGQPHRAWAFGLGLERLAMVLFDVPDIRLFWSDDDRFLKQFRRGDLKARFKPYSKYPSCYKDMAFWTSDKFSENNLCELVRGIGGDLVEEVTLIDKFDNKKTGKTSNCFRIVYRSMERSLTDEEINALQDRVRATVADKLEVVLR